MIITYIHLQLKPLETKMKDMWHDNNVLKAYQNYMVDVAVLLGADRNRAIKELNETFVLELQLFQVKIEKNTISNIK